MSEDLYKIYRALSQRARQDADSPEKLAMKETMKFIVRRKISQDAMLNAAEELIRLENSIRPKVRTFFALRVKDAIVSGKYCIEIPYPILHRWKDSASQEGYIYIACSSQKPNQLKLGATTMALKKRESLYRYKYGYQIQIVWSKKIKAPFLHEKLIQDQIESFRVAGLTHGDSNEWYFLSKKSLTSYAEKFSSTISND